jgi:hypothetical protein
LITNTTLQSHQEYKKIPSRAEACPGRISFDRGGVLRGGRMPLDIKLIIIIEQWRINKYYHFRFFSFYLSR